MFSELFSIGLVSGYYINVEQQANSTDVNFSISALITYSPSRVECNIVDRYVKCVFSCGKPRELDDVFPSVS